MRRMKEKLQMPVDADEISLLPLLLSPPAGAVAPWIELPVDLTANILRRLEVFEILECAQLVCTKWWQVCQDPAMWRVIKIVNDDDLSMSNDCTLLCLRAMDRSQGHLLDLTLAYFGSHVLLLYIANRSRHLKRLTLVACRGMTISLTSLTGVVRKLPRLEELHLTSSKPVLGDFEAFAIFCSKLTSFSVNCRFSDDEGELRTPTLIAKTMPNLCHLGLLGNEVNNEGLEAILDGCPRLESLDLRRCFNLDLGGALGKRCRAQLKNLSLPSDSMDDWEWNKHLYYSDDPDDYYFDHDDVDSNDMCND